MTTKPEEKPFDGITQAQELVQMGAAAFMARGCSIGDYSNMVLQVLFNEAFRATPIEVAALLRASADLIEMKDDAPKIKDAEKRCLDAQEAYVIAMNKFVDEAIIKARAALQMLAETQP